MCTISDRKRSGKGKYNYIGPSTKFPSTKKPSRMVYILIRGSSYGVDITYIADNSNAVI